MQSSPFARPQSPQVARGTTGDRSRARGRGRGRGRGASQATPSDSSPSVQQSHARGQRAGLVGANRGVRSRGTRGRGSSANVSRTFNTPSPGPSSNHAEVPPPPITPRPEDVRETNHDVVSTRRTQLHAQYDQYKKRAIQQGLMSDPDKPGKLENAITTKGTCTHMCDEKERVDRIFESQLDRAEMLPNSDTGRLVPIEGRMVKRFRRAAAGVDQQLPEELRTPRTLRKTMDYLINNIIGLSPRLAQHHKFVWDRTRAIRNDCSIQSFTQPEDVKVEVDCYERIARFHILSSHLLSKPDALQNGEDFVAKQEIEQLTKTFQTLIDKYDGFGHSLSFPHEAEFRAYFILFAPMTTIADLDDQVQKWPKRILHDGRVQTALRLRAASESTDQPVGSRRFDPIPCFIAQKNAGLYWDLLKSQQVGYLMACVAEMSFRNIRFAALDSLWRAGKNASEKGQATMRTWTKPLVRDHLGFDDDQQVEDFCSKFGLNFVQSSTSVQEYLDFKSFGDTNLDYSSLGLDQVFSESIVEQKRHGRALVAIINGMSIAEATRQGLVTQESSSETSWISSNKSSLFLSQNPEDDEDEEEEQEAESTEELRDATTGQLHSMLNPLASSFTPSGINIPAADNKTKQPRWMTQFGQARSPTSVSPGGPPKHIFGASNDKRATLDVPASQPASSTLGTKQEPSNTSALPALDFTTFTPSSLATPPNAQSTESAAGPPHGQQPTSLFQFAQPVKPTSSSTDSQIVDTERPKPAFVWFKPATDSTPASAPPQLSFEAPKRPAFPVETPKSSFNSTNTNSTNSTLLSPATTRTTDSSGAFTQLTNSSSVQLPQSFFSTVSQEPQQVLITDPVSTSVPNTNTFVAKTSPSASGNKAAPLGGFKSTPVFKPVPDASSTSSAQNPVKSNESSPDSEASENRPNFNQVTFEKPQSVAPQKDLPPPSPTPKTVDKDKLVEHLCRIGLTQKDGILDMFVAAKVNNLCHNIFRSFQIQHLEQKLSNLKKTLLKRKFFTIWRSRVREKRHSKRVEKRKRMFAASIKAQNERERRRQDEVAFLAEVMESEKNKRRIQAEERQRQDEKARQQQAQHPVTATSIVVQRPKNTNITQTAGQKRKMLTSSISRSNIKDISMSPSHKRSRTLGANSNEPLTQSAASLKTIHSPSRSTSSNLRRSLSHRSLRQSIAQQGVDQTESDYFRLKALGVDPNTPLIPDTAATLAAKQRKEAEHREAVLNKIKIRPSSTPVKSMLKREPEPTMQIPTPQRMTIVQSANQSELADKDTDDDPFLRQLREARQAMTADADWLKSQTGEMEKEIKQQEEFRRSTGSNDSPSSSFTQSVNGMARNINGYEYVAPTLKPGQTLSRTEQRIRATGARGLASIPIGARPQSRSQYTPIAMSRRSASQLRAKDDIDQAKDGPASRKRGVDEVASSNGVPVSHNDRVPTQITKRLRNDLPQRSPAKPMTTRDLDALRAPRDHAVRNGDTYTSQSADEEVTEDDETGDELEYLDERQNGHGQYAYGDGEEDEYSDDADDDSEDDEDTADEDEEEEEDADTDPDAGIFPVTRRRRFGPVEGMSYDEEDEEEVPEYSHQSAHAASVSAHGSRAVSASVATPDTGLGSTVEEAIELSD